ncbi:MULTISPECIES: hypothetical protein [unclassified Oceanobacter]|jgi:hypothetical protein|uniref:hypothetical protein n=1 Tax=unclassified Oceanobacter TaxID=2620260 RepID=UPI002735CA93|nr:MULTISPECIES: hypothetical protein [unclassified Oceanobacter]MDP2506588.1 hypothetical protein [Oceanobacter sp. 3_MG-2023]MDP2548965.1 hypothetical protein [Oceanobacter sp. 4_MG-2023]
MFNPTGLLRYGTLLCVLPAVALLIVYGLDLSAITECQQQGLTYSPELGSCIASAEPITTYYARHTLIINISLLIATAGALAMTVGMVLKGPSQGRQKD